MKFSTPTEVSPQHSHNATGHNVFAISVLYQGPSQLLNGMKSAVLTLAAFNTLATDVAELGQFVREADSVEHAAYDTK